MKIKIAEIIIEIELLLIVLVLTCLFSINCFYFFKYFFFCYLFILFHELSHIVVGSLFNRKIKKINLCLSGVSVTFDKYNKKKFSESIILIAGPLSNVILALMFKNVNFVFSINIFLAILNLIPIYPMDGYRILQMFINKNIDLISNIFLSIFLLIAIIQIAFYMNFSFLVFYIYLQLIKLAKKQNIT